MMMSFVQNHHLFGLSAAGIFGDVSGDLMLCSYSEYLKRDDQYLAYRTLHEENTNRMVREARDRDRALAQGIELEDEAAADDAAGSAVAPAAYGSKTIVIHPGSQNLRIGLASDALPKTVPMVIARKWKESESEEDGGEPKPKRLKVDNEDIQPERAFGDEVSTIRIAISMKDRTLKLLLY